VSALRLFAFVFLAVIIAELTDWRVVDQLMMAAVALLILTYLWSRLSLRGLVVSRQVAADRAQVGQPLSERISMTNRGRLAKLWVEVRDLSTLPDHQASRVINVRGRGTSEWTVTTICARRGRYHLGPMRLRSGDPFGLFPASLGIPTVVDLLVYPAAVDLRSFPFPNGNLTAATSSNRHSPFVTSSVAGVRDYVPGDAYNRISWSSTARAGRLMVKEFDDDPTSDVWIVLDLDRQQSVHVDRPMPSADGQHGRLPVEAGLVATEEYAITIAASLAHRSLEQGRNVGLIASAAHYTVLPADRSDRQYLKLLELLAVAQADGQTPLAEVLVAEARRFTRQSTLIVVTSSTDESWIGALAGIAGRHVRVAVIYVEPETFGPSPSSLLTVSGLLAAGIPTHLVKCGDNLTRTLGGGRPPVPSGMGVTSG
jgi:uncharacterized protein (DUF58 family)